MQKMSTTLTARLRLGLIFFPVFFVLLAALYFLATALVENHLLQEREKSLVEKLHLTVRVVAAKSEGSFTTAVMDPLADELAGFAGANVVILSHEGLVLGDSSRLLSELAVAPNYALSEDIQLAGRQGFGRAIRMSARQGLPVLDLAMKAGSGFVRLEQPLQILAGNAQRTHTAILITAIAALLMGGLFTWLLLRVRETPSHALAAPPPVMDIPGKDRLAILNAMAEGVMVTDTSGRIRLVNPAFQRLLGVNENPVGQTPLECLRNQPLDESIRKALDQSCEVRCELSILTVDGPHVFDVLIAPLPSAQGLQGTVAIWHDLTRLKKLEGLRQEFVANVSHEFKTPLTAILGYTETLLMDLDASREERKRFVEKIHHHTQNLKALVEDVLKLSRIESEAPPRTRIELGEFLRNLVQEFNDCAAVRQQVIELDLPTVPFYLTANATDLRLIFSNLIDNALKFTPDGGQIFVRGSMQSNKILISVRDTGIGMEAAHLPRIFERFFRVDPGRSRDKGGTGLGLAIVKHLVQSYGGKIEVQSEPDQGTVFTVHFYPQAVDNF